MDFDAAVLEFADATPQSIATSDLPENWQAVQLGDVARLKLGRTPARAEPRFWKPGQIPWVSIGDLPNGWIRRTRERISIEAHQEVFKNELVPAGTLLMSFKLTVGKVGILEFPAVHNEAIVNLRVDDPRVDRDFLFFLLQSLDYDAHLDAYVKGKTLNKEKLARLPLALPPLSEQRAIAHVLRTVAQSKAATEAVITANRELKKSLMRYLFTYGPVPLTEAEHVPIRETNYGHVPKQWLITPLSECARVQTGAAKGRKIADADAVEVPYLRVANVQDGYLDLSEIKSIRIAKSEVTRFQLQDGDVVVTEGGDFDKLGRGFIWRSQVEGAVHQNHVFAIRADPQVLIPDYLAYLVQSKYAKSYFLEVAHRTTNLACINSTKLKALPALIPPFGEQHAIVSILQAVDRKIEVEESRRLSLDALFQSLLHNLMTGKVRVGDLAMTEVG